MIIEFIGTPGAGKTTLLPIVADYLCEQGIHARTVVDAARPYAQRSLVGQLVVHLAPKGWQRPLLWQVFYHLSSAHRVLFMLAHPRLIDQVVRSQVQRPIAAEARYHALHWFFHLIGHYQFLRAHARPDEALILDEGFIHRVVQMNAWDTEEPDPNRIAAYLALVPRPDLVIAVNAPWHLCLTRIYRRGLWTRFRSKSRSEVAGYVYNAHRVVSLTVEQMRGAGWPLIEVDNSRDDGRPPQEELRRKLAEVSLMPRTEAVITPGVSRGIA